MLRRSTKRSEVNCKKHYFLLQHSPFLERQKTVWERANTILLL